MAVLLCAAPSLYCSLISYGSDPAAPNPLRPSPALFSSPSSPTRHLVTVTVQDSARGASGWTLMAWIRARATTGDLVSVVRICYLTTRRSLAPAKCFRLAASDAVARTATLAARHSGFCSSTITLFSSANPSGALAAAPVVSPISPAGTVAPIFHTGRAGSLDSHLMI